MRPELIKQIAATFELCGGAPLNETALGLVVYELEKYRESEVLPALQRCRTEVKGKLSLADIIQKIPKSSADRPSADIAFAMLPQSEAQSVVWTREMAEAHGVVRELLETDPTGARMAFRDAYTRLCDQSLAEGKDVEWEYSAGTYAAGRETVLKDALKKGRMSAEQVKHINPELLTSPQGKHLLPGPKPKPEEATDIQEYITALKKKMGVNF